ncbi:MAG: Hsp33 family molecular chaperone HslO, partial [Clostridia bacterium]|nr:Hsp33 family molecular chaperone HslO [Clostridia bacterium]
CTFMASNLKNQDDRLYVVVAGDGVGGKITVCGNRELKMRAYIDNPSAELPLNSKGKLDVGGCVGKNGRISVVKSMGLKEPYSGTSALVSGEIAEDFAAYYTFSEQQPTAMALGVKIGKDGTCIGAGGVILQALPGATDENLKRAEELVNSLTNVSTLIEEIGAEGIMKKYFGEGYDEYFPEYKCLCDRAAIEKIIISLGKAEAEDIIKQEGSIKVGCQFCNKEYVFTKDDVRKIFS